MNALARALAAYPQLRNPQVERIPHGLIHQSFAVRDGAAEYVLQRVGAVFSPAIHENILAVTEHLSARGFPTARLLPSASGPPSVDLGEDGLWRLLTRMPGVGFEVCSSPAQARSAAALVARFHSALADLEHDFRPLGLTLHDPPAHFAALEWAVDVQRGHRLHGAVASLARSILAAAREAEPLAGLPRRVVHGDLKFNNLLFEGDSGAARERAVCLIDFDTVSRLPLWTELGDAWRSWCNRRGEDSPEAELDLEILRAAVEGYLGALSIELAAAERSSLAHGLEQISLELAARFAADALNESYFAWDPERFPSWGEHNLVRARGQLSLATQARETRAQRLRMLAEAPARLRSACPPGPRGVAGGA